MKQLFWILWEDFLWLISYLWDLFLGFVIGLFGAWLLPIKTISSITKYDSPYLYGLLIGLFVMFLTVLVFIPIFHLAGMIPASFLWITGIMLASVIIEYLFLAYARSKNLSN